MLGIIVVLLQTYQTIFTVIFNTGQWGYCNAVRSFRLT